jgi:hypothetical protein
VIKNGALPATCIFVARFNSLYCPDLPVTEIATGTNTLSYIVPSGSRAPFDETTFIVAQSAFRAEYDNVQPTIATDYITVTVPSSTTTSVGAMFQNTTGKP